MNRRTFLGASIAAVSSFSGCGSRKQPFPQLTKAELESDMADRLKLRDVTLTDQGGGRFTGTGKDADGKLIELEVTQDKQQRKWKNRLKGPDGESSGEGGVRW